MPTAIIEPAVVKCPRCIGGRLFIEQIHGYLVKVCVNCGYQRIIEIKKEALWSHTK